MAWELEIHHIDVGQGESTLIIARDPNVIPIVQRSLLIDGGLNERGQLIDGYIGVHNYGAPLDHIAVSHYDVDHSGGITSLLIADNRYVQNDIIAQAAANAAYAAAIAPANNTVLHQVAAATAAAVAAILGAYSTPTNDQSLEARNAGTRGARNLDPNTVTNVIAARDAITEGEGEVGGRVLNDVLIARAATVKRRAVAKEAGIAAGTAVGNAANRYTGIFPSVHRSLEMATPTGSRFTTVRRYHTTNILDVGDTDTRSPDAYRDSINGSFTMNSNHVVTMPRINRQRTTPNLGDEILWNSGPTAQKAPANAPAVFVLARNLRVRGAPNRNVVGDLSNSVSMGLVVRFNNFFYYMGGDLPIDGEDLVLKYLIGVPPTNAVLLTDPQPPNGTFPAPTHLCCFKCGHHGASNSSSPYFVTNARADAAFVSCGVHDAYRHPDQTVIDELHNNGNIRQFYLTNCNYDRTHVPGYDYTVDQLNAPNNKSRISGDNNQDNTIANRHRGDIVVFVNQAESISALHPPAMLVPPAVYHQFRVRYWEENDPLGPGPRIDSHAH